jgi:hypothetical protein
MNLRGDRNQCCGCGEYFNSTAAFDKHRTGDFTDPTNPRRCLELTSMYAKGMSRNRDGFWVTAVNPLFSKDSPKKPQ